MKKIIKPGVREEAEYVCDVTGKPAVATLRILFDYGSDHDWQELRADFCNETANEVLALLQSRFPQLVLRDCAPFPLRVNLAEVPPAILQAEAKRARSVQRKSAPAARKPAQRKAGK